MENNTQTQKDIFDLNEQEFISYFKEKIGPDFEKYKESAASLYPKSDLIKKTKINIIWIVINLIIVILIPAGSFLPFKIFFCLFVLLGFISLIWEPLQYKKMQNPNLKYTSKEKLLKAIGFDYFSLNFFEGFPCKENELKMKKYNAYRKIIHEKFYHSQIDEVIHGYYHDMPFILFDLCTTRKTSEKINWITGDSTGTSILLATKIKKPFKNEVRIDSGAFEGTPIALEDIEFNKEFKVFAQDQVEARYLLTATFMERLLKYRKEKLKYAAFPEVLFSQQYSQYGNVFIHILTGNKDMFQLSRWNADNEISAAKAIYRILQEIKEIMLIAEALKLDQDIGL